MTGKELRIWRAQMGLNQYEAGELLGYSANGISKLEIGHREIRRCVEIACAALLARQREIEELEASMSETVEAAGQQC